MRPKMPGNGERSFSMIGQTISYYGILQRLGGGGMGVVYRTEDTHLKLPVARNSFPKGYGRTAMRSNVSGAKAQSTSAPNQPNICMIHEIGGSEGWQFFVVELLEGETWRN